MTLWKKFDKMRDVATENTQSETVGNVCESDYLILTIKVWKCG